MRNKYKRNEYFRGYLCFSMINININCKLIKYLSKYQSELGRIILQTYEVSIIMVKE